MKKIISLLILSIVSNAENLTPPSVFQLLPGEVRIIKKSNQLPLAVDYFIMKEGSKLILDPSLKTWNFTAKNSYFYKGAKIIGRGKSFNSRATSGINGGNGGNCHTGNAASHGSNGSNGLNGLNINLQLGLVTFGDLLIDVSGGKGGNGGNGGKGGSGGRADISEYCKGGSGGIGGNGGNGGSGGNGGNVNIIWWEKSDILKLPYESSTNSLNGLKVIVNGGKNGTYGNGGSGGDGGTGRCKNLKLFKTCRGSGPTGTKGERGKNGISGRNGISKIQHTSK